MLLLREHAQRMGNFRIAPVLCACLVVVLFFTNARAGSMPVSAPRTIKSTMRQSVDGDGYGGEGFTVRPLLDERPLATAIIIHGLGGTGEEWGIMSLGMSVFSLNYVKFIIPSAETKPVTYLNTTIPSWFDIRRIQGTNSDVDEKDLRQSVDRINRIIDGEVRAGVPAERIFIVGFSQGGALALTTFLRSKRKLGGCVGVATWLPLHNSYAPFGPEPVSENVKGNKILMIHVSPNYAHANRFCVLLLNPRSSNIRIII